MIKKYLKFLIAVIYARIVILDKHSSLIKLSYGSFFSRPLGGYIHGGQVKTYNLRKIYPEFFWSFNCIYLVSSALPFFIPDACKILKKRGFKIILNQNGVGYPAWTKDYEKINAELRKVYENADIIFYQSNFAKISCKYWLGSAEGRELLAYNPVNLQEFVPKSKMSEKLYLLSASTFQRISSIELIFDVARELIRSGLNFQWEVAGYFSWSGGYDQVVSELQKRSLNDYIYFTGVYGRNDAAKIFQKASIFVHVNTAMDVCPTSVIEALSTGLPVVGLNSGGMPELVDPNSGVLVNLIGGNDYYECSSPTVHEIVQAIFKVSENIEFFSKNARKRAEVCFDEIKWLSEHQNAIKTLMSNKVSH
jgi:glycosyltransferase involved in cell wall biosynthesis